MKGLTEWRVCGGISGVSTQRLDALLLRNPLRNNPKDVRGSEADQYSLQAGMLIDKLLNSNHLCVFVSQTQRGYTVVVLYWPPAICGYSCKRYKYIVCMYFEEVNSLCNILQVESSIYTPWVGGTARRLHPVFSAMPAPVACCRTFPSFSTDALRGHIWGHRANEN